MAILKSAQPARAASAEAKPIEPSQKKPCFVISPIGPDDTETRKRADQVLKHIIKKALSDTYDVKRADDISKPGLITLQVIERLMKAPMVVADLTDANANVYYELAIRHFVKKPVVHLITEGQQPPFDVAQMRYIPYDLTDPDSVERAAQEVYDHAAACERGEVTFTPIQFVEMLDAARGEGENQFVSLALGIQSALSNLQSDVRQLGTQVSYLTSAALDEHSFPNSIPIKSGKEAYQQAVARLMSQRGLRGSLKDLAGLRLPSSPRQRLPEPRERTPDAEPTEPPPVATGGPVAPPKDDK